MTMDKWEGIPTVAGNWFNTVSGKKVSLVQPDLSAIDIKDIAIALGNIGRFSGQTNMFFSVADHCLLVSHLVENAGELPEMGDLPLIGLLHDSAEAYVGDVTSPLKVLLPEYRRIEDNMLAAILQKFGLPTTLPEEVVKADLEALAIEADYLFVTHEEWSLPFEGPAGDGVGRSQYGLVDMNNPAHPRLAGKRFLQRFEELTA